MYLVEGDFGNLDSGWHPSLAGMSLANISSSVEKYSFNWFEMSASSERMVPSTINDLMFMQLHLWEINFLMYVQVLIVSLQQELNTLEKRCISMDSVFFKLQKFELQWKTQKYSWFTVSKKYVSIWIIFLKLSTNLSQIS